MKFNYNFLVVSYFAFWIAAHSQAEEPAQSATPDTTTQVKPAAHFDNPDDFAKFAKKLQENAVPRSELQTGTANWPNVEWPSFLATSLGGISVLPRDATTDSENTMPRVCWQDPSNGYFLFCWIECGGAHVSVFLTKDRRMVGDKVEIQRKPLPLSSANGIKIGMTREELLRKLGQPSRTAIRGKRHEYWCALYKSIDNDNKQALRNTYIFKDGKLIEISVFFDSAESGDADEFKTVNELIEKSWPFSKF